ncbi:hypothetical protein [Bradyrhizobium japonicum]|uniref:hypothetical protein n=1 Tax=Bradyrhizobium japonicum TaxID=375 RepID=UPI001BA9FAD7|nr:hypothetical protein [Bradyrhizobium japonicum]
MDGVFHPGDCQPLAWHLEWALGRGLSPHVAVAAFMPPRLVQYGPGESWDANGPAPALFQKYANVLVRYIAKKSLDGGASSVIFEVSNEADIADSAPENWSDTNPSAYTLKPLGSWGRWLWWIDPAKYVLNQWPPLQSHTMSNAEDPTLSYPYQLDARRLPRQLLPVQKVFSQAIVNIRNELAAANLFKMYDKMSGQRVQAALTGGAGSHLNAFATWDGANSTANIMVYNYDPTRVFGNNVSTETPEGISLEVDNLPFSDGSTVTIERYLIDANTSNLAKFYSDPTHPDPNLQRILLQRTINGGKLVLTGDALGLGVVLYRILPPTVVP